MGRTQDPDGQVAQRGREDELVVRQAHARLPRMQQPVLAQRQRQLVLQGSSGKKKQSQCGGGTRITLPCPWLRMLA